VVREGAVLHLFLSMMVLAFRLFKLLWINQRKDFVFRRMVPLFPSGGISFLVQEKAKKLNFVQPNWRFLNFLFAFSSTFFFVVRFWEDVLMGILW